MSPEQAEEAIRQVVDTDAWRVGVDAEAERRARELEEAHTRVRQSLARRTARASAAPQLPVDVLGIYVLLPPIRVR